MAFLGNRGGVQVIQVDDSELKTYGIESAPGWPLSFSADGAVLAYRLSDGKPARARIVVNGREGPLFDKIGPPFMSRDGRVIAYWVEGKYGYFIRVGNRDEPTYDFVTDPAVSADGSTVAYASEDDNGWTLRVGNRTTPLSKMPSRIFLSPDGRHVGWIDFEVLPEGGSKMRVIVNGRPGEAYGIVGSPSFSPSEPLAVYGAEEGGRTLVVIGTRKVETPDRVGDPVFSPDGRKVGYGARIGRELIWKVIENP